MKERPILFSAPMVRAILDGRKTQTRRVAPISEFSVEQVTKNVTVCNIAFSTPINGVVGSWIGGAFSPDEARLRMASQFNRYGRAGDRLWVRESFKPIASGEVKNGYGEVRYGYAYRADSATRWNDCITKIHDLTGQPPTGAMQFQPRPWKPSIHMPRSASRIMLEITGVRIERLQAISEADAIAEGITSAGDGNGFHTERGMHYWGDPVGSFCSLWESINGAESWKANPWVWVVQFKRVEPAHG